MLDPSKRRLPLPRSLRGTSLAKTAVPIADALTTQKSRTESNQPAAQARSTLRVAHTLTSVPTAAVPTPCNSLKKPSSKALFVDLNILDDERERDDCNNGEGIPTYNASSLPQIEHLSSSYSDAASVSTTLPDPDVEIHTILTNIRERFSLKSERLQRLTQMSETDLATALQRLTPKQLEKIKTDTLYNLTAHKDATQWIALETAEQNLRTQMAMRLHEHASIRHEDRAATLHNTLADIQLRLLDAQATTSTCLTTAQDLNTMKARSQDQILQTKQAVEALKREQGLDGWKCTATLQLVSQMYEVIKEFQAYGQRIIAHRAFLENVRRKHHNRLQELRGNLRVFCRIRPVIETETATAKDIISYTISKEQTRLTLTCEPRQKPGATTPSHYSINGNAGISMGAESTSTFTFDHVFSTNAAQEDIFKQVSNLIQSALDGFNVALFAYGQTGSGKTYTMEGKWDFSSSPYLQGATHKALPPEAGITPRAVDLIFSVVADAITKGWEYRIEVSILEIYNETVRDLLASNCYRNDTSFNVTPTESGSLTARNAGTTINPSLTCEVKLDAKGNVIVTNLTSVPVRNPCEVYNLLRLAHRQRAVASTACNERSSRSHSLFQLKIQGRKQASGTVVNSTLSLVDLAGSERLDKSLATGDRLREAQHINRSLSCLCDVIYAIAGKKPHIPFRNSKLTMVLKDSLGGNAKTLMLVNISPLRASLTESINSLRLATRANSCIFN